MDLSSSKFQQHVKKAVPISTVTFSEQKSLREVISIMEEEQAKAQECQKTFTVVVKVLNLDPEYFLVLAKNKDGKVVRVTENQNGQYQDNGGNQYVLFYLISY